MGIELILAMVIASVAVKHTAVNGALDVMFARRGQAAPHHDRAMKRLDLYRDLTSRSGRQVRSGQAGSAGTGQVRSGQRRRAFLRYCAALWSDSWDDARSAHDRKHTARVQARESGQVRSGAARGYFAGLRRDAWDRWDRAWYSAAAKRQTRRSGQDQTPDLTSVPDPSAAPDLTPGPDLGTGQAPDPSTDPGPVPAPDPSTDPGPDPRSDPTPDPRPDLRSDPTPDPRTGGPRLPWHLVTGAEPGARGMILGRYETEADAQADLAKARERAGDDPDAHYWINGPRPTTVPTATAAGATTTRKAPPAMTHEITGLKSAIVYFGALADQCVAAGPGIEHANAALAAGEVGGEAAGQAAAAAEHLQAAAACLGNARQTLETHLSVTEAYAATGNDAGSKEFVTAE